jgi:hypothetical protein
MEVENHSISMADKDKDNKEEEEDNEEEEEVTNLLPTMANTANINHPLSGSTTVEEEVDSSAPMPSVKRATAPTPATALTLATPAPARWATRSMRTSTTEGLKETRPGKRDPHSHFHGRWQHYQQHSTTIFVADVWRTILAISCFGVGLRGGAQRPVHQIAVGKLMPYLTREPKAALYLQLCTTLYLAPTNPNYQIVHLD